MATTTRPAAPRSTELRQPGRRWSMLAWLVAPIAALALRTFDLTEIPRWATDEGFWAMPARDMALFSQWTLGYFHHYLLSPWFTGVMAGWFFLVGPGMLQARVLMALAGVGTVALIGLVGRRLGYASAGLCAAIALAFDGPSIITNRSVLLETLQTLLLVGCALLALGHGRWQRLGLAVCFGLALLTKLLSVYAGVVIVAYAWHRWGRRAAVQTGLVLLAGVALAGVVFGWLAVRDWSTFSAIWWAELSVRETTRSVAAAGEEGGLRVTLTYFLTRSPLLLVALLASAAWLVLKRRTSSALVLPALWTGVGIVAMTAQGYSPQRYYMPVLPFAWLWVFMTLKQVLEAGAHASWKWRAPVAVLALQATFAIASLVFYYGVLGNRETEAGQLAGWAETHLGRGDRVLAPFRLGLALDGAQFIGFEDAQAMQPLSSDVIDAWHIRYVVTAPETRAAERARNLLFVEADPTRYTAVARFGDTVVYRRGP
jgi:4-amino-4-deoxy-L-arabinose transferase-like glycosyltransferase